MSSKGFRSFFSHINQIRKAFLLLFVLLAVGTYFYSHVEGWSFIDSLYFSVATITTVGYGDLHPTKDITKIFTMIYILVGFGVVLYILTSIVTHFMEKKVEEIERLDKKMIDLEKDSR